jgi:hypothetical protein
LSVRVVIVDDDAVVRADVDKPGESGSKESEAPT